MGAALAYVPPNSDVQKHLFSLPWCLVAGGPILGCKVWARAEEQLSDPSPFGPAASVWFPLCSPPLSPSHSRSPSLLSVLSSFHRLLLPPPHVLGPGWVRM